MDWGLFRSKDKLKYGLREKILYPRMFYYWAVVSNFILRFFWIIWLWQDFKVMVGSVNVTKEL